MNMPTELRQAVEAAHGGPVDIVDGERHYVLIQAELYERLRTPTAADDWEAAAMRGTMAKVMAEDWNDPLMDSYDTLP